MCFFLACSTFVWAAWCCSHPFRAKVEATITRVASRSISKAVREDLVASHWVMSCQSVMASTPTRTRSYSSTEEWRTHTGTPWCKERSWFAWWTQSDMVATRLPSSSTVGPTLWRLVASMLRSTSLVTQQPRGWVKVLVWFWIIYETLVLTSILSV